MYDYDQEQHPIMGEAPALVAPPPLPRTAPLVSLNGVPSEGLRLVVRTVTIKLTGDYTGYWATMRLNPRRRVRDIVAEPLVNLGWDRARIDARVAEVMREVVTLWIVELLRHGWGLSSLEFIGSRQLASVSST